MKFSFEQQKGALKGWACEILAKSSVEEKSGIT